MHRELGSQDLLMILLDTGKCYSHAASFGVIDVPYWATRGARPRGRYQDGNQ